MASTIPTEADEQIAVVEYCDARHIPIFHIPNGGERRITTAAYLKKQGVKPGVPDLCIPIAKGKYHGLYIEMKRRAMNKCKVTQTQREWISRLKANGYAAFICPGAENAIKCINWYLEL